MNINHQWANWQWPMTMTMIGNWHDSYLTCKINEAQLSIKLQKKGIYLCNYICVYIVMIMKLKILEIFCSL